jgi:hypothetical protein
MFLQLRILNLFSICNLCQNPNVFMMFLISDVSPTNVHTRETLQVISL